MPCSGMPIRSRAGCRSCSTANFRYLTSVPGTIAVVITLAVGVLFLDVQIVFEEIRWIPFFLTMLVGVNMLALMGLILAGLMLVMVNHLWDMGAAVAGSLFLFSGAVFPLEVLPVFIRWIGYLMPVTYWLELLRRFNAPEVAAQFPTLTSFSDVQLFGVLILLTVILALIASVSMIAPPCA